MIWNAALSEEIEAVNAICGRDALTPIAYSSCAKESIDHVDHVVLRPPGQSSSFILSFDHHYPESCPQVDGIQSTGNLGKGEGHQTARVLQEVLLRVWTPGVVCLFDLIEEVEPLLRDGAVESGHQRLEEKSGVHEVGAEAESTRGEPEAIHTQHPAPDWAISEPITEKKSVFVARCTRVGDKEEVTSVLTHLLSTNKKVAGATHNITAWRIRNAETGVTVQDCDDDGESAAGGRLLHLMQLMDVWNILVVVSRWYGGVKLGPDRFRLLNQTARDALIKVGFAKTEGEKSGKKRAKK